jgi:hypothetical protein
MADERREDEEFQPLAGHIHLVLPGVNKPVVLSFPADKITVVIIIFLLCATGCVAAWLIFVKGKRENVAGVFGNKPPAMTECPPCERAQPERRVTPTVEPEPPPRAKVGASRPQPEKRPRPSIQRERRRPSRSPPVKLTKG